MSLETKPLSELTSQDLQELADSRASEDLTHEFKRDLPSRWRGGIPENCWVALTCVLAGGGQHIEESSSRTMRSPNAGR